jgi:hypothetical protein
MGQGDAAMACEDIFEGMLDDDGNCLQDGEPNMQETMETTTYEVDSAAGTLSTLDEDGQPKNETTEYCVQGDTLTVVVHDLDDDVMARYSATRL